MGIGCFRGSEEDVFDRVLNAVLSFNADIVVEITGDCPLVEPAKIDQMLFAYTHMDVDFMANGLDGTYPPGLGLRIFSKAVLEKVNHLTQDPVDGEHVTNFIWEHPDMFSIYHFQNNLDKKFWNLRLTVDTSEDFVLIDSIFQELYPAKHIFSLYDILDLFERKPELMEINRHIKHKPIR